jgi:hypothetical protein
MEVLAVHYDVSVGLQETGLRKRPMFARESELAQALKKSNCMEQSPSWDANIHSAS